MTDLPNWVYDVIIELQRWNDEHPNLYTSTGGTEGYFRTEKCGCEALGMVPDEVRAEAKVIAEYLRHADGCSGCGPQSKGPWIHTCELSRGDTDEERQSTCKACAAEAEQP
jgi:hypothetical protein